ncbi:unnamed protein product, partial [Discosporangium mesarthrocarpum]
MIGPTSMTGTASPATPDRLGSIPQDLDYRDAQSPWRVRSTVRNAGLGGLGGGEDDAAIVEGHEKVWASRRSMARAALSGAKALRPVRGFVAAPVAGQGDEDESTRAANQLVSDGKGAVVISAAAVAIGAATLRFGGRAALVQGLGMDFIDDAGTKEQVESFLEFFNGLGSIRYLYFLGAWTVAKTFWLDFLSIALALSSGIVFGGVFQGALLSSTCATLASVVGFQLARTRLKDLMVAQVEKRPALKALERVVAREGFKTVVTLRLAPVLPIPLGAYNYVYGITSLTLADFLSGTFIGSFKPYLLDSYLGVFGASVIDGGGGDGDYLLGLAFFAAVLVGTFASQVAGRTWDELSAEVGGVNSGEDGAPRAGAGAGAGAGESWEWQSLWGLESSSMPEWFQAWQERDRAARDKMWGVMEEEWGYMETRESVRAQAGGGAGGGGETEANVMPRESPNPPPG